MALLVVIFILLFGAVVLLSLATLPLFTDKLQRVQTEKVAQAEVKLSRMFIQVEQRKLFALYTFAPIALMFLGFLLSRSIIIGFLAGAVGLALPTIIIRIMEVRRKASFRRQLVDGLMILSSSLKAGLSLLQTLEVLVEEMPAPISEEFGLIVRENKMGVTLEDSLINLNQRMGIEELALLINAILVARETGGDLTKVFHRLATTIRDNRKLQESIQTLTMQGRLQGLIMSVLPVVFVAWVISFNRHHFDIMFNNETGRLLLIVALVLQVVGIFLIKKFSTVRI